MTYTKYKLPIIIFTGVLAVLYLGVRVEMISFSQKQVIASLKSIEMSQKKLEKVFALGPALKNKGTPRNKIDFNKVYKVDIGDSVVWGNPEAPVTIIKWTDFQCPYCADSTKLVNQVLQKYPNKVRVVIKNFPLNSHRQAMKAAKYALAANEQGKHKEMYYKIFRNFRELRNNEDLPLEYAKELGLDMEKFIQDANSTKFDKQIREEINQLRSTGMRLAVPKFLINGQEPKRRDINSWSAIIDGYIN